METKRVSWLARAVVFLMIGTLLFTGCASTSRMSSNPEGARVYVNGIYIGETPCVYRYRAGLPETYILEVRKPGYKTITNATLDRTLRADVSLALLLLAIVPYFFSARLEDQYIFELEPEQPEA
jgi:hypothetical protein